MPDTIDIPVLYKDETLTFTAQVLAYGYSYKLSVDVNGSEILFEPDEEGGYRAVLADVETRQGKKTDRELVKAITETLSSQRKS